MKLSYKFYESTFIRKSSRGFGYASNLLNADNVFVLQLPVAIVFVLINVSSLIGIDKMTY